MNEEDDNNRRLLLAGALCFAVMVAWQALFPAPEPPAASETPTVEVGEDEEDEPLVASTSTLAAAPAVATSSTSSTSATVAARTAVSPAVQPKVSTFEGAGTLIDEEVPYVARFTNVGGAFEGFELPSYRERGTDTRATDEAIQLATPVMSARKSQLRLAQMAGIELVGESSFELPSRPVYEVVEESADAVRYRFRTESGVVVERSYRVLSDRFTIDFDVTFRNESNQPQTAEMALSSGLKANEAMKSGGGFFAFMRPPADHLESICEVDGSVYREALQSLDDGEVERTDGAVRWIGVDRQYFLSALIRRGETLGAGRCELSKSGEIARSRMVLPAAELAPGKSLTYGFTAYLGVKESSTLEAVSPTLDGAINYTILGLSLAPVCEALLWIMGMIFQITGSWGLAIIGLTVLVKGALFPLNQRQGKSMRAMSALRPQMDAIREKHPEDKQRQSEEMMRLYREHNVNPAAGCLPILVQMPIWLSLYRALSVSVDLYQEGFLWIPDLTARDPYYVLPVVLMAVMFLQQRMMPAAMDPAQQKIMQYTMPLMFGLFMFGLPAGLCFYILVNSLLTILQQWVINRTLGPMTPAAGGKGLAKDS